MVCVREHVRVKQTAKTSMDRTHTYVNTHMWAASNGNQEFSAYEVCSHWAQSRWNASKQPSSDTHTHTHTPLPFVLSSLLRIIIISLWHFLGLDRQKDMMRLQSSRGLCRDKQQMITINGIGVVLYKKI